MINWKLRFKNKATLIAFLSACVTFVYQILGIVGITPAISESAVVNGIGLIVNILVGLGVVVDPTTKGIGDSNRAMEYKAPNDDDDPGEDEDWEDIDEEDDDEYEDPADDEELPQ